jgi:hypothetical protein
MNTSAFQDNLIELLANALDMDDDFADNIIDVQSYADYGLLTDDKGIVVRMYDGSEFQLTLKRSK